MDSCCACPLRVSAQASSFLRGGPAMPRPPRPCPLPCPAGAAVCPRPAGGAVGGCVCAAAMTVPITTANAASEKRVRLEIKLEPELHDTRIAGTEDPPEVRAVQAGRRVVEVGLVQHVEHFPAELEG